MGLFDKHRKTIKRVFWIVLVAGSAALGVYQGAADPTGAAKWAPILLWLGLMAVSAVAIDVLWYQEINKKLSEIAPILQQQRDADRYIIELEALLGGKRSHHLQQVRLINLSAAYAQKEDYQRAKELLQQIDVKRLLSIHRPSYWANMALVHFFFDEQEEACAIMEQQEKLFSRWRKSPALGPTLAPLDVLYQLAQGDREQALQLLAAARQKWQNEYNSRDFDELEEKCREQ